jgi:hypothetical protein
MLHRFEDTLLAVVRRPGASSYELRDPAGARLRCLREQGFATAVGKSPKSWFPTASGERLASRCLFEITREVARRRRLQALADFRAAEALYAFADALLTAPRQLSGPSRRALRFGELACTLKDTVGRRVLVTTDAAGEYFAPITSVGTIDSFGEERDREDWLLTLEVDGSSFVQFSRRHFVHAIEDGYCGELRVRQGAGTTVVWLDID